MSLLLTPEERRGLLIAVISGGRPQLKQRPTSKFLNQAAQAGHPIAWVVSENQAETYEKDDYQIVAYPTRWAYEYAASHWTLPGAPQLGEFLGAFVGLEYACLEAERRGCWGVLQLDDNISSFLLEKGTSWKIIQQRGGLAYVASILGSTALSTNGRTVGAQLSSIPPKRIWLNPGFPYSCFVEMVGEGREHWYGPFEDDIMHSLQYGNRAESGTALTVNILRYVKESKSTSGMRKHYNHERSKALARIYPEVARSTVKKSKSNGMGGPRVFHHMRSDAIRTPLVIRDKSRFMSIRNELGDLIEEWGKERERLNREKMRKYAEGR